MSSPELSFLEEFYLPINWFGRIETTLHELGHTGPILEANLIFETSPIDAILMNTASLVIAFCKSFWRVSQAIFICEVQNDKNVNAFATKHSDTYIIVVYSALINTILRASSYILETQIGREFFGGEARETAITKGNFQQLNRLDWGPAISGTVENLDIELACGLLATVMFHEIAHIVNGHIDLIKMLTRDPVVNGISVWGTPEQKLITRETLEFDADAFSAAGWNALASDNMASRGRVPALLSGFLETPVRVAKLSSFLCTIQFLHDDLIENSDNCWILNSSCHSPSFIRAKNQAVTLTTLLVTRYNVDRSEADSAINHAYSSALQCFILISGRVYGSDTMKQIDISSDLILMYLDSILGRWATLRDTLQAVRPARLGKLAQAQREPS